MRPNGKYATLWQAALERRFVLVSSPLLCSELAEVLRRQPDWSEDDVQRTIRAVAGVAELVQPAVTLRVAADPDDDRVLECAIAGNADLIVSNDRHLRTLRTFRGIAIITGADFRRILGV
ncbi:MAG TPA: putative toxin-antitoxin system toxin component, PIN family [Candidatus Solibacter sp.]|nr:putative toxin-antitoxin system toxin component, PIN family [Candidatus Solibacter sp.]